MLQKNDVDGIALFSTRLSMSHASSIHTSIIQYHTIPTSLTASLKKYPRVAWELWMGQPQFLVVS